MTYSAAILIALASVVAPQGPATQEGEALVPAASPTSEPQSGQAEPELEAIPWPVTLRTTAGEVVLFQPQIDDWKDYTVISARSALAVTLEGSAEPAYGALTFTAQSKVDLDSRTVLVETRQVEDIQFPHATPEAALKLRAAVEKALPPERPVKVALDLVLANIERTENAGGAVEVSVDPPPIFYSDVPAILVMFMDEPTFTEVEGTSLLYATNTNWDVFRDSVSSMNYLRNGESWLQAPDPVAGPWTQAKTLPAELSQLPSTESWARVKASLPGKPFAVAPKVFTSTRPSELILVDGKPQYTLISGTKLLYVKNTDADLFLLSGTHYFLTAGRWFSAPTVEGPWTSAMNNLPSDFMGIPDDHEMSNVLASVPGTPEADEAVLQASIPRKVTVDKSAAKVEVVYEGDPSFVVVEGTTVYYAVNSPNDVFKVDSLYYCCYQGVWFVSSSASGPWQVAAKVPAVIYQIPSTHPKHNVTYVYVYDSTPTTVVVGYTSGYTGTYVAYGVVMFGLGYWLAHDHYHHHHYHGYHCHPHYYGYGCHAHYDHYHGSYHRGSHAYGPYGGAGRGASYNPSTGTYRRGAAVYGPEGSRFAQQAYNPRTGARAAQRGGTSPYGSWSQGAVSRGNQWARGGRATDGHTTVGGFETSRGAKGIGATGPGGSRGAVRTRNGDVYVGRDGNVYKREGGQWHSRQKGGWSRVDSTQATGSRAGSNRAGTPRSTTPRTERPGATRPGTTKPRTAPGSQPRTGTSGRTNRSTRPATNQRLKRDSTARSRGNRNSQRFRSSGASRSRTQSAARSRSSSGRSRGGSRSRTGGSRGRSRGRGR